MPKILTRFSTYVFLVALSISIVAEFYSIVGLTTIFSGAVLPVIVMGVVLGLGKIIATVWLKINWHRASITYKIYLIPAIFALMFLTSMGIFGFLSKSHSEQSQITGDALAKVEVYDERIATARGNIEANRRALQQMDEAVDQVMARSSTEAGAGRAVTVRRSQARERARLQSEIAAEQATIARLNEERAPFAAEVRKIEAETGPLKYIAAMIYGENPDANLLESAVRWVIILIVVVFDPLALILLLAAQQSYRWERQQESEDESKKSKDDGNADEFFEKSKLLASEIDRIQEEERINKANSLLDQLEQEVPRVEIPEYTYNKSDELTLYPVDDGPLTDSQLDQIKKFVDSDPTIECHKCGTELVNAPGIGPFCPNKECDVIDGPFDDSEPITFVFTPPAPLKQNNHLDVSVASDSITVDADKTMEVENVTTTETTKALIESTENIATENVTVEKVLYHQNDNHVIFEGKKMSIENLKQIRPDLVIPPNGKIPNVIEFGAEFPKASLNGDTYVRIDSIPHRVYKFNGRKWMAVDKTINTTYLTNLTYLRYLIQKLESNEYDPEFLTLSEQDEIENYLTSKKT